MELNKVTQTTYEERIEKITKELISTVITINVFKLLLTAGLIELLKSHPTSGLIIIWHGILLTEAAVFISLILSVKSSIAPLKKNNIPLKSCSNTVQYIKDTIKWYRIYKSLLPICYMGIAIMFAVVILQLISDEILIIPVIMTSLYEIICTTYVFAYAKGLISSHRAIPQKVIEKILTVGEIMEYKKLITENDLEPISSHSVYELKYMWLCEIDMLDQINLYYEALKRFD